MYSSISIVKYFLSGYSSFILFSIASFTFNPDSLGPLYCIKISTTICSSSEKSIKKSSRCFSVNIPFALIAINAIPAR